MLINLSNHPKEMWHKEQLNAARKVYGEIIDLPFPQVDPHADELGIAILAERLVELCKQHFLSATGNDENVKNGVHVMGEMTLTCNVVNLLFASNIEAIASTTSRVVSLKNDNEKIVTFRFVRFRKYNHQTEGV